jgi:hypothetical protein
MIDTGEGPTWTEALAPDRRSLAHLSDKDLQAPFIIEQIARWHGCTLAEARDAKGSELRRRTITTERPV